MQKVTLLCGVPGSGKTWVMSHLGQLYEQIHNDDYIGSPRSTMTRAVWEAARKDRPVIIDCPFAERELREDLNSMGLQVTPVFIVEDAETVQERYEARENRPISKANLTRAETIVNRAREWGSVMGTSDEILKLLRG